MPGFQIVDNGKTVLNGHQLNHLYVPQNQYISVCYLKRKGGEVMKGIMHPEDNTQSGGHLKYTDIVNVTDAKANSLKLGFLK